MLNQVTMQGRLTADPKTTVHGDTTVTTFSLAVQRDFKPRNTDAYPVDFFDCSAFGNTGKTVQDYFVKASPVIITGRLQMDTWTDRNGGSKSKPVIIVNSVYFAGPKPQTAQPVQQPVPPVQQPVQQTMQPVQQTMQPVRPDDRLPF